MMIFFLQSDLAFFVILAVVFIAGLIFILALCTAMYFYIKRSERRAGADWAGAARELGLQIKPATPEMLSDIDKIRRRMGTNVKMEAATTAQPLYGKFSGRPVEVIIRQTISSQYSVAYHGPVQKKSYTTCCEAALASRNGLIFRIKSRNGGNFISRAGGGGGDLQINYPLFDSSFAVYGQDLQKIYQMLCAKAGDRRTVAERFVANFSDKWLIEATEEKVVVKFTGMVTNAAALSSALQAATELALRIETALAK